MPNISRSRLKTLIESGHVQAAGETITEPAYRVKPQTTIQLEIPRLTSAKAPIPQNIPLNIHYEDDDLIVVNKPPGLIVHPAPGNPDRTLVNALIAHCGNSLSGIGGVRRPGIVHRLDKDTSGLLVAAKNDAAHRGLSKQFEKHTIERAYLALVWGAPKPSKGTISGNIGRNPNNRKKMSVLKNNGRHAVTNYITVKHLANHQWTLLECQLETGRTHQIRVHLTSLGHNIVGDPLYGGKRTKTTDRLPIESQSILKHWNRQALHAFRLGFNHPKSSEFKQFETAPPSDMIELIKSGDQNC